MIKNIPFTLNISGLTMSDADKEQLSVIYENASRKVLDILAQKGVAVANVTLNLTNVSASTLEEKVVAITSGSQVINPTSGKAGMSKVTIDGVNIATETTIGAEDIDFSSGDAEIEVTLDTGDCTITLGKDSNLVASNIKKDVVIYGVTGTYQA